MGLDHRSMVKSKYTDRSLQLDVVGLLKQPGRQERRRVTQRGKKSSRYHETRNAYYRTYVTSYIEMKVGEMKYMW